MHWTCVKHALNLRWTCVGHAYKKRRSCIENLYYKCIMFWACLTHVQRIVHSSQRMLNVRSIPVQLTCNMRWTCVEISWNTCVILRHAQRMFNACYPLLFKAWSMYDQHLLNTYAMHMSHTFYPCSVCWMHIQLKRDMLKYI